MPPSPLKVPRCSGSRSAEQTVSSGAPVQSYIRTVERCSSSAMMTQHHARGLPCSIAGEVAGRLLDDCTAGSRGRASACSRNAAHMAVARSGCRMLLGTSGHTSCPRMRGFFVTSTTTTRAAGMLPGEHLCARATGPMNRNWSPRTP